jgi:hypothetical protein
MSVTNLPLVLVEWDDAWINEVSVTLEDVGASHKPTTVHTLGWLLREDDVGVSLANEHYDATYRGRTFIPRAMVREVTRFTLTKPRPRKTAKQAEAVTTTEEGKQE